MKPTIKSIIWNIRKKKEFNQNSKKKKELKKNENRKMSLSESPDVPTSKS